MANPLVSVLVKNSCHGIGEGPHWESRSKSLLYVDINGRDIHRYYTETAQDDKIPVPEDVGFAIPRTRGGYVIGQGRKFSLLDWDTKKIEHIHEVDAGTNNRLNDGKCDASGRLWAGTMGHERVPPHVEEKMGSLFSLDSTHQIKSHLNKIDISNGLAWSEDNSVMYYIDSIPRKVYAFDFDLQNGVISNQRVAVDYGGKETFDRLGVPDGMCIDAQGKLWVACFFGSKIVRFDPETGKELQHVDIPARRTTSCCFGGPNMDELFVTCAAKGGDEAEWKQYPLTGSLFKVTGLDGVKGAPVPEFAG